MKRIILGTLLILLLSNCTAIRALRWWQPDLSDSRKFDHKKIIKAETPFRFATGNGQKKHQQLKTYLDTILNQTNTNAFVIIKNDSIIYERYADQMNANTLHPSFSIAKSYIGTLVGIAVDKGIIASTNDLVIKYLPELEKNDDRFKQLTVQHVLDMRASLDFDEEKETPFSDIVKLYYGPSLKRQISNLKMKSVPGKQFEYQSIATQLLASILERASGESVDALLGKYLWQPLGAESNAIWSVDDQKMVKAFCCLNATAIDFAKLGRLYLKNGDWQGKQLLSKKWIYETTNPDTLSKRGYKNQFWALKNTSSFKDSLSAVEKQKSLKINLPIMKSKNGTYYFQHKTTDYRAEGILGQILYVNPDNNVIIVRLGNYPNKNIFFNGFIPSIGRQL